MPRAKTTFLFITVSAALLCSCAGAMSFREQAPLPEREIAEAAAQIEDIVLNASLENPSTIDFDEVGDEAGLSLLIAHINMDEIRQKAPALAELNIDNELVLLAIRGRVERRPAVREFEKQGCVGENRRGLLMVLKDACEGDRYFMRRLGGAVLQENTDRRAIYEQIVEANDLGKSAMGRVREIFAEQIYRKAWAGTPLEMPDGAWKRR